MRRKTDKKMYRGAPPRVTATVTEVQNTPVARLMNAVFAPDAKTTKLMKAEDTAYALLAKSDRYVVGTAAQMDGAIQSERTDGYIKGRMAPRSVGEARSRAQRGAVGRILQEVFIETQKAIEKHGSQSSPHEGYAVLLEELDELWDEIKADRGRMASARKEAIQVAAMAVRYVLDNNPR